MSKKSFFFEVSFDEFESSRNLSDWRTETLEMFNWGEKMEKLHYECCDYDWETDEHSDEG